MKALFILFYFFVGFGFTVTTPQDGFFETLFQGAGWPVALGVGISELVFGDVCKLPGVMS